MLPPPSGSPATPTSRSPIRRSNWCSSKARKARTINHLGVEVETGEEVVAAEARLNDAGLAPTTVEDTVCCYAGKTETWVTDPDGARWEWYVKRSDSAEFGSGTPPVAIETCAPAAS